MTAGTGGGQPPELPPPGPRWSPFPVQDWSTMPAPERLEPVGRIATAAPEQPGGRLEPVARRRILPTAVILLVVVLIAAGLYGSARAAGDDGPASSVYLPADGAAWSARLDTISATGNSSAITSVESARLGGVEATQTVDQTLGRSLLTDLDISGLRSPAQVWRVSSVERAGTDTPARQRNRFYRVDRGVELMVDSGSAGIVVYTPGLRELPADPRPGGSWTSSGRAGPDLSYIATLRAAAGGPGCLRVTGTVAYASRGIVPARTHQVSRVWCRGRGLVAAADHEQLAGTTSGSSETVVAATGEPGVAGTGPVPSGWTGPASWTARRLPQRAVDGGRADPLATAPAPVPPVAGPAGELVRPVVQGRDVLVARTDADGAVVVVRLHPGGSPTMLDRVGDVLLVASTDRTLTGYTAGGVRIWRVALGDVVVQRPVVTGSGARSAVAVATAAGTVWVIDPGSGTVRWRAAVGADVAAPPSTDGSLVLVADRSGGLTALSVADGTIRWQTTAAGVGVMAVTGDTLVSDDGTTLEGRALADGRLRWRRAESASVRVLLAVAGQAVVTTDATTTAYGPDGRIRWRAAALSGPVTEGGLLAGLGGPANDTLVVLDAGGRSVARLAVGAGRDGETRYLVPGPERLFITSSVYTDVQELS